MSIYFLFFRDKGNDLNWEKSYHKDDTNPYGTYVLQKIFKDADGVSNITVLEKPFRMEKGKFNKSKSYVYFFIGNEMHLHSKENTDSLLAFIAEGNTGLFISNYLPYDLADTLFKYLDYKFITDSLVQVNYTHPDLAKEKPFVVTNQVKNKQENTFWYYYTPESFFSYDSLVVLSNVVTDTSSLPVFIKIPFGKGEIYFHSLPLAFTNYYLLQESGKEFAEKAISHIPDGEIIWDYYSTLPYDYYQSDYSRPKESPLQYILSQQPLRWAYYLLLFSLIIYAIFASKRKQKIIPAVELFENSSVEFVETVSRLYFLQKKHKHLIKQIEKIFFDFVRNRYHISGMVKDKQFMYLLSKKSNVDEEILKPVFNAFAITHTDMEVDDDYVFQLYRNLDKFYKTCK
jgi:hypothetical protein